MVSLYKIVNINKVKQKLIYFYIAHCVQKNTAQPLDSDCEIAPISTVIKIVYFKLFVHVDGRQQTNTTL